MKMKLACCLMICILMLSGIISGCADNNTPSVISIQESTVMENVESVITDSEIQKAVDLGLVPLELRGNYEAQINYCDFCSILDNFISLMFPDDLSKWKDVSSNCRNANDLMTRMDGVLTFFYAAECCGLDEIGFDYNIPLITLIEDNVDFYEGVTWGNRFFPNAEKTYYNETVANSEYYAWRCEQNYYDNAIFFAENLSYGNGKPYFDYDDRYSLNFGKNFTRGDAIRAVERLYETARFVQYVPASQASSTVSENAIAKSKSMPKPSPFQLPDWKGYTVGCRPGVALCGAGMLYQSDEIKILHDYGFNFVRAPLDTRMIFEGNDTSKVNPAFLETMDDLIEFCAEYGMHVCFDIHEMPGFYTDLSYMDSDKAKITLWDDEKTQNLFVDIWRFLAEYCRDIPSELISFNLLNEPHSEDNALTDEVYSKIMLRAVNAIHDVTPERLIFADMLGFMWGTPVEGLAGEPVVQTLHPYFLQNGEKWPMYSINGFIHCDNGIFTVHGHFPEGTTIEALITDVHGQSRFSLNADGESVSSISIGNENVGENGCISIEEEGTEGEYRSYEGISWTSTLTRDYSRVEFIQENGCWYWLQNVTITTPSYSVTLHSDDSAVRDSAVPILSIDETGQISAADNNTIVLKNSEWLESKFQSYHDFTERTDTQIMVQEFGFNETIDNETAFKAADAFLSVLDSYQIPWCSWGGYFGPIGDGNEYHWRDFVWSEPVERDGAEYEIISDNWMIDIGLMDVFQKHIRN